nr:hypothetical protein [uncultured Blautia sp.]
MLKWNRDLLIGENIKNIRKIQKKLNSGRPLPGIYLVTLSDNPSVLLEILPALTLIQEAAADICPEIIGITKGKDAAFDMVSDIIREVYHETGEFRIKEYWKNR